MKGFWRRVAPSLRTAVPFVARQQSIPWQHSYVSSNKLKMQCRNYVYLPTSWTELKLRMRNHVKTRTVQVKLFLNEAASAPNSYWKTYAPPTLSTTERGRAKPSQTSVATSFIYTQVRSAARNQANQWRIYKARQTHLFRNQAQLWQTRARDLYWARNYYLRKRQRSSARLLPAASFWARNSRVPSWISRRQRVVSDVFNEKGENLEKVTRQPHQASNTPDTVAFDNVAVESSLVSYTRRRFRQWYYKTVTLTEYSENDWFDSVTGKPLVSRDATGRFVNPWMSQSADGVHSIATILKWQWQRLHSNVQQKLRAFKLLSAGATDSCSATMRITSASRTHRRTPFQPNRLMFQSESLQESSVSSMRNNVKFTWMGHNSCLLQSNSLTVLTDPIFSPRSSPFTSPLIPIGISRYEEAKSYTPRVDDIPEIIDLCLISHDHYDHLDTQTVLSLRDRVQQWVVPLGIGEWLQEKCDIPFERIVELEWWESVQFQKHQAEQPKKNGSTAGILGGSRPRWIPGDRYKLRDSRERHPMWTSRALTPERSVWVTCCPAQHWSSRTFFDRNYRLWCSFACYIPRDDQSPVEDGAPKEPFLFYFGGDTALPNNNFPLFEQISDYLGKMVDLAALPIGAYAPNFLNQDVHMNPSEAVVAHRALRSKQSIGIHWGTFALSEEPVHEPAAWLCEEMNGASDFVTIPQGSSRTIP